MRGEKHTLDWPGADLAVLSSKSKPVTREVCRDATHLMHWLYDSALACIRDKVAQAADLMRLSVWLAREQSKSVPASMHRFSAFTAAGELCHSERRRRRNARVP